MQRLKGYEYLTLQQRRVLIFDVVDNVTASAGI